MRIQLSYLSRHCILLLLSLIPAKGQLHLMTGAPTPKEDIVYASALFRVEGNGTLKLVVPLAVGSEWVSLSYSWRKALINPSYRVGDSRDDLIKVIDFDKAAIVKACKNPPAPIGGLMDQWLIDSPTKGHIYVQYLVGDDIAHGELRGMIMDPSVACDKSFVPIDPSEGQFVVAHGSAGLFDIGGADSMGAHVVKDGSVYIWLSSVATYLDHPVPKSLMEGVSRPGGGIMVNNESTLVLGVGDGDDVSNQRLFLFRKSDKSWRRIPVSSQDVTSTRGFGNYIVVAEAQRRNEKNRESAGRAAWRKSRSKYGPHVQGRFNDAEVVYPGRLHIYTVDSGKVNTIVTNQGDSEVLLVEDGQVYYRVSDALYQAVISDDGISVGKLLVKADEIRDVHWAFVKH